MREHRARETDGNKQYGVKLGDIRSIAKRIKTDHARALSLWETRILDARLLAILLMKPQELTTKQLETMVKDARGVQLADWLQAYVVKIHPQKEVLRLAWMDDSNPWVARAGWGLTSARISKDPEGLDLSALLDRIESTMPSSAPEAQWTMNFCLAGIGIHHAHLRHRAIAIGERLGIYRDYPVSKGCTSPFAPVWIAEMVSRNT
ncbi:DNA alkylation repair protein [soil metagenome]